MSREELQRRLQRLREENEDPDLLPVPERDFLSEQEAEADDSVDLHERDHPRGDSG